MSGGLIPCPVCEGDGVVITGTIRVYEHGCYVPHDDIIEERCDYCDGEGEVWDEGDEMTDEEAQRRTIAPSQAQKEIAP